MKFLLSLFILLTPLLLKASEINIEEVSKRFYLQEVHTKNKKIMGNLDKIFLNTDLSRGIFVADNIKGRRDKIRIIKLNDHVIVEVKKTKTTYTSFLFYHFNEEELSFLNKDFSFFKIIKNNLFNQSALASEEVCLATSFATTGVESSSLSSLNYFGDSSYFQNAMSCATGVLQGIWDSTGGLISSLYEGTKSLIKDPKKFWNDKVEQFEKLKEFITHFDVEMKRVGKALLNLPTEVKAEIFCGFIGGIGTDILLGVLTGGTTIAPAMVKATKYIDKVLDLSGILSKLSKLGNLKALPKDFLTKLMKAEEKVAKKLTTGMQKFSKNGLDDLALGYARCAL